MKQWPASLPDYAYPRESWWKKPATAVAALAFHCAYLAGRAISLIRSRQPRAVMIRTDGIGDAVLAEPLIASFSKQFPDSKLELWATAPVCQLYDSCLYIARTRVIPRGFKAGNLLLRRSMLARMRIGYALGRHVYDVAAYLNHSPEPLGNWLISSMRARQRWHVLGDTHNQFPLQRERMRQCATWPLEVPQLPAHELIRNAWTARLWGDHIVDQWPTLHLSENAEQAAQEQAVWLQKSAKQLGASGMVGLVPGSATQINAYPASAWNRVLRQLWTQYKVVAVWLGESDANFAEVRAGVPCLRPDTSLSLTIVGALLPKFDAVIGMDTGLMHMALAQRAPSVVLCGGGNPGRFFPWPGAAQGIVLNHRMPCEGCNCRCTQDRARCVTEIDPTDVVAAVDRLLQSRPCKLRKAI